MTDQSKTTTTAQGVRIGWLDMPEAIRAQVEDWLGGAVVEAVTPSGGFSPGVVALLRTADGRKVFIKAASPAQNPDTPAIHRREARIMEHFPAGAPVPRLLWSIDDAESGWFVALYWPIKGRSPAQPWQTDELLRVLDAVTALATALTPSPLLPPLVPTASEALAQHICGWQLLADDPPLRDRLDDWSLRHLEGLARLEAKAPAAAVGDTLLHFDLRADNMLIDDQRVWIVDWPHAAIGAAWVDMVLFAPSVRLSGGLSPEELLNHHAPSRAADSDALNAVIASLAGYFTQRGLLPPPPGLPTVRAFQAAQGVVTREWLAQRLGWR
ncbi:MAG: phosphotransferase [Chloroflexota bacterium]